MIENPVRHGYVERWTDWPWSSAPEYLAQTGPDEAERIWREYPLDDYGKGWEVRRCEVQSSAFGVPPSGDSGSSPLPRPERDE